MFRIGNVERPFEQGIFFGNLLGLNRYIFDGILYLLKQSLNIFLNKHCLRASRFKLKMRNWRKKVNIMLNWIKMKTMKKRYMYICTKKKQRMTVK